MPEVQQPQPSGEQFKAKIEQGVNRALPAEQVKNLKAEVKAETEKNNALKVKVKELIKGAFNTEKTQDLVITPEEKQAIFNDVKANLARHLGNEQEAKKIMDKFGINTAEKLMYRIGLRSVEEQRLYERFADFIKNKPGYVLGFSKQIKDAPWGKDMMTKAAEKSPVSAFYYYKEFSDMQNDAAKQILLKSAEKDPEAAFKYIDNYKDMKGAEEVLKLAVEKMTKPEDALKYISKLGALSFGKDILIAVVNKMQKPEDIFKFSKDLIKTDGAADILLAAINKTKDKEIAFTAIDQYKTMENAHTVLLTALPHIKEKDLAFTQIEKYPDMKNADSVLLTALMMGANSENVFTSAEFYKNLPNAKSILTLAAATNPENAMIYLSYYADLPANGAKDIARTAVSVNPEVLFQHIDLVKDSGKDIINGLLLDAVKSKPELAFSKLDSYKNMKPEIVKNILNTAAALDPGYAIKNFEKYNDQDVLKTAANNIQPRDFMNDEIFTVLQKNLAEGEYKKQIIAEIKLKRGECLKIGREILKASHEGEEPYYNVPDLFLDPSIQSVLKVSPDWIKPPPDNMSISQARVIIARNLFSQKLEASEKTVLKEWQYVREQREGYNDVALFKNRNIVFLADNETQGENGPKLFAGGNEKNAIKEQGAKNLEFSRCDYQKDSAYEAKVKLLSETKTKILNQLGNTKPPLTFYYTGHGGPNSITIDGKKLAYDLKPEHKSLAEINYKEFAQKLIERHNKFPDEYKDKNTRPIIVLSTCYSSTFLSKVYNEIGKQRPLPIGVGTSEFNQQVLTDGAASSAFENKVINLSGSSKSKPSTIGQIMKNEETASVNPTVFIPRSKVGGVQLT